MRTGLFNKAAQLLRKKSSVAVILSSALAGCSQTSGMHDMPDIGSLQQQPVAGAQTQMSPPPAPSRIIRNIALNGQNILCIPSTGAALPTSVADQSYNMHMINQLELRKRHSSIGRALSNMNARDGILRCNMPANNAGAYHIEEQVITLNLSYANERLEHYQATDYNLSDAAEDLINTDIEESAHAWQFSAFSAQLRGARSPDTIYMLNMALEAQAKIIAAMIQVDIARELNLGDVPFRYALDNPEANMTNQAMSGVYTCVTDSRADPSCLADVFEHAVTSDNDYSESLRDKYGYGGGVNEMTRVSYTDMFGRIPGLPGNFLAGHIDFSHIRQAALRR